jgi:hypothetical protein
MTTISNFFGLLGFVAAISLMPSNALGTDQTQAFSPLSWLPVTVVVEIQDVKPQVCPGLQVHTCDVPVRLRVEQILRDRDGLGLAPGELEIRLPRWVSMISTDGLPHLWSDHALQPGQRYIVACRAQGSLEAMLRDPDIVEPVTPPVDSISDVQLILRSAHAPVVEQAETAALTIRRGGVRSWLFAYYVAELLKAGRADETAALLGALNSAPASVFSDDAKETLAVRLSMARINGSDDLLHLFVRLTMRYFVATEGRSVDGKSSLSRFQNVVFGTLLPMIRSSDRARTALHDVMRSEDGDKLRTKIRSLAADSSISPAEKADIQGLFALINR